MHGILHLLGCEGISIDREETLHDRCAADKGYGFTHGSLGHRLDIFHKSDLTPGLSCPDRGDSTAVNSYRAEIFQCPGKGYRKILRNKEMLSGLAGDHFSNCMIGILLPFQDIWKPGLGTCHNRGDRFAGSASHFHLGDDNNPFLFRSPEIDEGITGGKMRQVPHICITGRSICHIGISTAFFDCIRKKIHWSGYLS